MRRGEPALELGLELQEHCDRFWAMVTISFHRGAGALRGGRRVRRKADAR